MKKRNDENESIQPSVKTFHRTIELNPFGVCSEAGFDKMLEMTGVI